ncbi:MAG: hypothetical protein FWF90_16145 [Promicromonosporaceae bacterium]|nr:hypothetical protein [Promicromonosporaceae bacterium]
MSGDIFDDPEARAWMKRADDELKPMIQDSAFTVQIVSGVEPDAKIAVELGFMILLDKPIILAVIPGTPVLPKLAAIADAIVEFDPADSEGTNRRLTEAMERLS